MDNKPVQRINRQLQVASDAIVCQEAIVDGEVTIGSGTVIHPTAQIIALNSPIIIGSHNLIEENASIVNESTIPMIIGDCNVFEIGCIVRATSIGNNNVIEVRARVGAGVKLPNGCVIGVGCSIEKDDQEVAERTVVYGKNRRRIAAEEPMLQTSQLEHLRKALPNYHYLTTNKKSTT